MISVIPSNLPEDEKAEWEAFRNRRLGELTKTFPEADKELFETKIWVEFLAFKYSFTSDVKVKGMSRLDYAQCNSIFGPDIRSFPRCYYHESVADVPELPKRTNNTKGFAAGIKRNKPLSLYNFYFKKRLVEYRNVGAELDSIQETSRKIGNDWRAMTFFERQKLEEEYFVAFGSDPP